MDTMNSEITKMENLMVFLLRINQMALSGIRKNIKMGFASKKNEYILFKLI